MDGTAAPQLATSDETTTTTTTTTNVPTLSLEQSVRNAAEFGWSIAELLGRCFLLQEEQIPALDWSGDKLVTLQGILTPREKIRALMEHMLYLANTLHVSSCTIDHDPDPDNGKRYIDVIRTNARLLTRSDFEPARDGSFEQIRGKINERIFFWDLKIHDALQDRPAAVYKAYLVGYSLGCLRWGFGLQNKPVDDALMDKVLHEYIPTLGPYVSQFATDALINSVGAWWKAISSPQGVKPGPAGPEGMAPPELQRQGHIWRSLLTDEADACSFLDPTTRNRSYLLQVLQVIWPIALVAVIALLAAVAALVIVIIVFHNQIVTEAAAIGGFLGTLGIAAILQKNVGDILQKAAADATATIKGSYLDQIWNTTQQKAVNLATFIAPPGFKEKSAQNTLAK